MGQVWEGRDELLGRTVAIKEVRFPTDVPDEERALLGERTLREARLTARLTHRGIVTIYDVILVDERPYIVMELFRAPSLATQIDEHGPLPPRDVAGIGLQLLDALAAAHREGILHRDVKPSNVLLADDRILLTDFGIATSESDSTLTSTGLLIGSPTYMSPERLRGEGIGPPADLWSLGATLYAALEAEPPFRATSTMGTITAVLVDEPRSPSVTGPLRDAILGMLDKDVQTRLTIPEAAALLRRSIEQPSGAVAPAIPGDGSETPLPHSPPVMAPVVTWEHPVHIKPAETPRPPSDGLSILEPVASFSSVAATPQGDGPPSDAAHFDEEPPGWPDDDESAQRRRRFALLAATALVAIALLALVAWTQLNEPDTTAGPGLTNGTEQTTKSEPTKSEPTKSEPTKSKPTKSKPTKSEPTKSKPTPSSGGNNAGPVVVPPADTLTTVSPTPTTAPTKTAPTKTTAPTTTAPPQAGAAPAGFHLEQDPLGFQVAVPNGWYRQLDGATRVDYVNPANSANYLRIDQQAEAGPSALGAWQDYEPSLDGIFNGYDLLRLESVAYRSWEAADLEFTYQGTNGTIRVLDRGFITDPRGFAILMSGPADTWATQSLPVFQVAAASFSPTNF